MKLEEIRVFGLQEFSRSPDPLKGTLEIGKAIGEAKIALTGEAWSRGFEKVPGKKNLYNFLFPCQVSQHGSSNSRHKPKRIPVYILGLVHEGEAHNLAYATSMRDDTEEINIIRLTNIDEITRIINYTPYSKK